jgi:hypothetical protein
MAIGLMIHHAIHVVVAAFAAHSSVIHFGEGFLGIGGSSSGTDRKQQLAGYGDLSNVFNTGMQQGSATLGQGQSELGSAAGYDTKILNGDRSSIMSALSPQISSITGQGAANQRQQAAMGTSRGGGTNAADQQLQQREQGQISSAVGGAQPAAAQSLAGIGATESGLGSNLLGLGATGAQDLTGDAINSYRATSANNAALGQGIGQLAAGIIGL